jgi:hypothetical protein
MGGDGMNCAKHGTKGVDQDNHCESCEEEHAALMDPEPMCFKCVNFRPANGIRRRASCTIHHDELRAIDCLDYLREIGAEG